MGGRHALISSMPNFGVRFFSEFDYHTQINHKAPYDTDYVATMTPARRKPIKNEQEVIVIDDSSDNEETLTGDSLGVATVATTEEVITEGESYWLQWMNSKDTEPPSVASKPYESEQHLSNFKTESHTSTSFHSNEVTSYNTKDDGFSCSRREHQASKKLKTEAGDNESHRDFMKRISQEDTPEEKDFYRRVRAFNDRPSTDDKLKRAYALLLNSKDYQNRPRNKTDGVQAQSQINAKEVPKSKVKAEPKT
jgi:lipopolysaccharide export LptBFGC system permease protein LptF